MNAAILVLSGILSGPLCAFLLDYPVFLSVSVLALAGALRLGRRWLLRMLLLAAAPAAFAVYGAATGDTELLHRALRWCTALAAGMYFAGELDAPVLLAGIRSGGRGPAGRFLGDLLLLLSLAGPAARRARETYSGCRRRGLTITSSVEESMMSLGDPLKADAPAGGKSPFPVVMASLTWVLMLWAVSGLGRSV